MYEAWHGRMTVFSAWVIHFPRRCLGFLDVRKNLPADGAFRVFCIDEIEEMRRDRHGQLGIGQTCPFGFFIREIRNMLLQLLQRTDAVFELPAPVIPIGVGHTAPIATV